MVFDGHCDIFTDVTIKRLQGETQVLKNHHLPKLRKGQIEGGCFVIWVDPPYDTDYGTRTKQILDAISAEMAECDEAVLVHTMAEIEKAKADGKFYILLGMEGLAVIGEDVDQIERLYDFGVRHAMLTWNEENALATGVQGNPARGVTSMGKKALQLLEKKHMLVDVSHLNERSFWDTLDIVSCPVLASHSNAKALANATRNLTDDQLLAIRDTDGLVGLNSFNLFVSQDVKQQHIDTFVKHIVYMAEKIGVKHLGFGFDFFEFLSTDSMKSYSDLDVSYTTGLEDCTKVPVLLQKLKEVGFTAQELEQICYQNWHHFMRRILG